MPAIKVGGSRVPGTDRSLSRIRYTRGGDTPGVNVPTPRKNVKSADIGELKAAGERLAAGLAGMSEEDISADFKEWRRRNKAATHGDDCGW